VSDLTDLAQLISEMDTLGSRISGLTRRPATMRHTGRNLCFPVPSVSHLYDQGLLAVWGNLWTAGSGDNAGCSSSKKETEAVMKENPACR
jgi:hypothetical protein